MSVINNCIKNCKTIKIANLINIESETMIEHIFRKLIASIHTHTDCALWWWSWWCSTNYVEKKLIENHFCSSVEIMSLLLHWQFRVSIKYARNLDFYFFWLFFSCILRAKSTHSFMQLNDLFSTKFSLFAVFGSIIFKWMACTSESVGLDCS